MDLERLAVVLRPRTNWEAVDLGIVLARSDWRRLYGVWLAVMVPVLVPAVLIFGGWGLLLTWWLAPLGEMALLFHLSRGVFASAPALKETLRAAPGLWRRGLAELLWRRPHPMRCTLLPIGQLERLGGSARRQRVAALASVGQSTPAILPTLFLLFEIGFATSILVLVQWLLPAGLGFDLGLAWERFFAGALPAVAYLAVWSGLGGVFLLLHPFHVACGFALYLDRRTILEGWDLEIAFRRMARRLKGLASASSAVSLVLGLLVVASAPAPPVDAQENAPAASRPVAWDGDPAEDPRRVARHVVSRPEFQRQTTETRWRLRDLFHDELAQTPASVDAGVSLANLIEPLLWIAAALCLALVVRAIWRRLPDGPETAKQRPAPAERLAGLDVRPDSLPDDIPAAAEGLWREGQPAASLSLLYRGALARLGADGLELRESFTEDDCLRVARAGLVPVRGAFFTDLTRAWQRVAYAHQIPDTDSVRPLWSSWNEHFGPGEGS